MSDALSVALEFLSLSVKTSLPAGLLSIITKYREEHQRTGNEPSFGSISQEMALLVKDLTGINLEVVIDKSFKDNAYANTEWFEGHSGVMVRMGEKPTSIGIRDLYQELNESVVDLERIKVTGIFTKIPAQVGLAGNFFTAKSKLTPEEVTAIFLHELGHIFTIFASVGEYVWLNYYLTDGVDVLLGKKPNKYKIEVLDASYLEKHLNDKELIEEIKKQPTEANARRALLEATGPMARDQLNTKVSLGGIKRSEQTADLFATRLGFGRALVTGLDKIIGGDPRKSVTRHVLIEIGKVAYTLLTFLPMSVATLPLNAITVATIIILKITQQDSDPYDSLFERYSKIRRDYLFQLRQSNVSPTRREILIADIAFIDDVLKGMNNYRTTLEVISQLIYPPRRRDAHRLKLEQQFERLMNNDLFLASDKLKSLA